MFFQNFLNLLSVSGNEHSGYLETMSFVIFQPQPLHITSYTHGNTARLSTQTRKETVQIAETNRKRLIFHNFLPSFNSLKSAFLHIYIFFFFLNQAKQKKKKLPI